MPRIDSILTTPLFQHPNVKGLLSKFLISEFNMADQNELINMPYSRFFNSEGNLIEEVNLAIRNAARYFSFDQEIIDETLGNLIFLSIIFSLSEYPDDRQWESFLNNPIEIKRSLLFEGVSKIWVNYQRQLVEANLNG